MNQILAVGNDRNENEKNNNIQTEQIKREPIKQNIKTSASNIKTKIKRTRSGRPIEIEGIIKFFSVVLIAFGVIFVGEGAYAMYKDADDRKPANIPSVIIGRKNDKAVVHVEHNVEISKIEYSWDNGERSTTPIGSTTADEEIVLLGYDSTLNLVIEDVNGKRIKYQKPYKLTGVDITKPSIEIETEDGNNNMTIIAKDETAISYISYQWEGEEPIVIQANQQGQKEIRKDVALTVGTRKVKIIAEDMNGNVERFEKEVVTSTSKPKMVVKRNNQDITIEVEDKDGIKDIIVNLNGKVYAARDLNRKKVTVGPVKLREGNNTISVQVINTSGYDITKTAELQYNP